jgi:hypothetical protein
LHEEAGEDAVADERRFVGGTVAVLDEAVSCRHLVRCGGGGEAQADTLIFGVYAGDLEDAGFLKDSLAEVISALVARAPPRLFFFSTD